MTLLEQIQQNLLRLPPEKQEEVLEFITSMQEHLEKSKAAAKSAHQNTLKKSFGHLAASGAFSDIRNPAAWQRQIREDRPLPGRDL